MAVNPERVIQLSARRQSASRVLLTPDEAADRLRISRRTVRRWTRSGELPAVRIGSLTRYPIDELDAWWRARVES